MKFAIDNKAELMFILLVLLMLPTLYLVNNFAKEAKYKISCTPVIYVDSGLSSDNLDTIERNDTKICSNRCTGYCLVQIGSDCKGVYKAVYSEIYGIACVCELYAIDKDYADDCINENTTFKTRDLFTMPE